MFKNKFTVCLFTAIALSGLFNLLSAQNQIVLKPGPTDGKFTYLNSHNYVGRPDSPSLIAAAWTYGGDFGIGRSFFSFDLPQLPAGVTILQATLNLYYNPTSTHVGHGGENACKIERVITNWDENNMNWDNQPQVDTSLASYLENSLTSYQSYPNIDVTALVEAMYNDPQNSFGFRISLLTEETYRSMILASCNHAADSLRPSLVIQLDTCHYPIDWFQYEINDMACQFTYSDATTSEWHWNFGDNTTSTLQNPLHTYTSAGTYVVTLTAINECGQTTMSDTITICNKPVSDFTYRTDGQIVAFKSLATNAEAWYWSFGNGFFSNLENPVYHYLQTGTYQVCLLVTNRCGSDIHCERLTVEDQTVTHASDQNDEIETTPNPTDGEVKISDNNSQTIYRIDVCNTSGLLVKTIENINATSVNIDISNVEAGVYIIKVVTSGGEYSKMVIKR